MKKLTPVEKVQARAFYNVLQASCKAEVSPDSKLVAQVKIACQVLTILHPDILMHLLKEISGPVEDMAERCKIQITEGVNVLEKGPVSSCPMAGREAARIAINASVQNYGDKKFSLLAWVKWARALTKIISGTDLDVTIIQCKELIFVMEEEETLQQQKSESRKKYAATPYCCSIVDILGKVKRPVTKSQIMRDLYGPGTHDKSLALINTALEVLVLHQAIQQIEMVNEENNSVCYAYSI